MTINAVQPVFVTFANEAAVIGRLLGGYWLLELDLLKCVAMGTSDFDGTLKAMFGVRGEKRRFKKATELGRRPYATHGLEADFDTRIDALDHCREKRNQYGHHHFYDDLSGKLALVNLEVLAKSKHHVPDLRSLTALYVDMKLLSEVVPRKYTGTGLTTSSSG